MNELENLLGMIGFANIFLDIPEGTNETFKVEGREISISKQNGEIVIDIAEPVKEKEPFDDSAVKELISKYTEYINNLDDSVFVESVELANKAIDIKTFDKLLQLKKFTEAEAVQVTYGINYFSQIIVEKLKEKSTQLVDSLNCFKTLCR